MEKVLALTNERVKGAARGVDEDGRKYVRHALTNCKSPWSAIEELQQAFNLKAPGCAGAIQFLHSMGSSNLSINTSLMDGLVSQLDALVEKLDQNSRLMLLKQSIKLMEVKEMQCISVSIMKRLDVIPEKYLRAMIDKGLISVGLPAV